MGGVLQLVVASAAAAGYRYALLLAGGCLRGPPLAASLDMLYCTLVLLGQVGSLCVPQHLNCADVCYGAASDGGICSSWWCVHLRLGFVRVLGVNDCFGLDRCT